jgi:hypothetical protein
MKKYIVYETRNLLNNKIYIGSHVTNNIDDRYLGSGKRLQKAIKKYGEKHFKKTILFIFNNPKEMYIKEAELVNIDFLKRKDVYNLKLGGEGGWDHIKNSSYFNSEKHLLNLMEVCKQGAKNASIKRSIQKEENIEKYHKNPKKCKRIDCNNSIPYRYKSKQIYCSSSCAAKVNNVNIMK